MRRSRSAASIVRPAVIGDLGRVGADTGAAGDYARCLSGQTPRHPLLLSRGMSDESATTFRARADERPGAVVVTAEGELDLVGAPRLLEAMPTDGTSPVVLDLGGVGFMDTSGLRSLLEARQACIDAGRSFAIARPSEPVRRVLELVDLAGEFAVVDLPVS